MSIHTRARAKYARANDELFKNLIQRDPDICNNCFRLVAVTEERNYYVTTFNGDLWLKEVDRPDRRWVHEGNTDHQAGDTLTDGTVRCCECGVPSDTIRPVSKDHAMEHVERICDRLEEKDIEFDREQLVDIADGLLSKPEWQGRQDDAFAKAVEVAHEG